VGGEGFNSERDTIMGFCVHANVPTGSKKSNSHMPCCTHAIPTQFCVNYTCHAVPLPCCDSAMSFVKVCMVAGNIQTTSPTVEWIGMLLKTTFMELRVVARRARMRAGHPHAVSGQPMLIHTCHAMALRSRFQYGMVVA
jgi:hypothetical protein